MRYEDTSSSFSNAAAGPDARDDSDSLAAGSRSAITGNAISGEGTTTGSAGADIIGNAPGHIVALEGANGSDTTATGGSLTAAGNYGTLTMNQDGGYSYRPTGAAPENARDVFNYTLADASGGRDSASLTIDIGHTPQVAANAQQVVPGPDGVVTLPPGVELSDVHVVGRNLVIDMPDGSQMVIIDGAVFVPQLVLGGVEVPSSNLAALLIDSEPKPAGGTPQSSGGNFGLPPGPLDPGVPLGDLIPPTELVFTPPEPEEVDNAVDEDDDPEIVIIPDGQPAAVNAVDSVDESGLPERGSEPEGTLEPQTIETTTGVISIDAEDGIDSVVIIVNGVEHEITEDSVGDVIVGLRGELTITSVNFNTGQIGYSYTVTDNTTDGVDDFEDFTVVVTDDDGDTATGTLHIDILDDEPIARDDTDSITEQNTTATGNVMTASGTTNSPAGADTVGADDATLTAVQGVGPADTTFDINGNLVVQGQYGQLTIDAQGNYTYQLTGELPEANSVDVFTYTLTDGDGDTDTATLTISVPGNPNDIPEILSADPTLVDEDGLEGANVDDGRPGEVDSTEDTTDTGEIVVDFKGDVPADLMGAIEFINASSLNGQLETPAGDPITFTVNGSGQLVGSDGTNDVIIITITGAVAGAGGLVTYTYEVELLGPVEHPIEGVEDSIDLSGITVQVTDSNGDTDSATFTATIVDDLPIAVEPPPPDPQDPTPGIIFGRVDEDDLDEENGDNTTGNDDHLDGDDEPVDDSGDSDATTTGGPAGSLNALFSVGSDAPLSFSLSDDTSALEAQNLSSNGHALLYAVNGTNTVLTAYADLNNNGELDPSEISDGNTVFTLTIGAEDGSWLFNLQDQLDHSDPGTEDNIQIDFGAVVVATDADGDPVTAAPGAFIVDVDDDMPQAYNEEDCPTLEVINGPSGVTEPLDLNLPNIGADQPAKLTFGSVDPETGEVVLVADGDPVLDSEGNPVTSGGSPLHYEVIDADTIQAVTEGGDPVFEVNLIVNEDGTGSYTFEQFAAIDNGSGSVAFDDLEGTNAGNVQFKGVGADDADTTVDLLITAHNGTDNETVNTDSNSIGSGNNSVDDGETVRIDFVQNLTEDGGDPDSPPSGFNYGAHVDTNTFTGRIAQVQGEQDQTVAFTVWALNSTNTDATEPDRNPDGGFDDADSVDVTEVTVTDYLTGNTTTLAVSFTDGTTFVNVAYGISVRVNADGSVTFSGVQEGDGYGISTGSESFNAVAVQSEPTGTGPDAGSTEDSFDLGTFAIGTVGSGDPVDISVPILVTDADGDPVSCDIEVTFNPGTSTAIAQGTVNEAALDDVGSNPGSDSETVTIDLADSVGGTGPFTFALVGDTDHDGVVEGNFGTFTLQPDGHTVVYTLHTPVDDGAGPSDGTNPITGLEDLDFEVTGPDGTTTSTIKITIIDDVPTAENDADSVPSGTDTATGNVITGDSTDGGLGGAGEDTKGADNAAITAVTGFGATQVVSGDFVVQGEWGTLTIGADGEYSYVRDADAPNGETDTFTYTLTDGDGDEDTATLIITIANNTPTVTAPEAGADGTIVDEKGLAAGPDRPGEPAGTGEAADGTPTDNDDTSETSSVGTITFTPGDTPATVTINGTTVDSAGDTVAGLYGTLTIVSFNAAGTITYTYTLADNVDNTTVTGDSFTVEVTDADGQTASDTFEVAIIDDAPIADNDTDAVVEGETGETGNVITGVGTTSGAAGDDRVGADDSTVTAATGFGGVGVKDGVTGNITVTGQWGTIVIEPDGEYTYTLSADGLAALEAKGAGQTLTPEVVTYTLTDGDGSTDTATLTISLTGTDDTPTLTVPDTGADTKTVDEAGLPARTGELAGTGEAADPDPDTDDSEIVSGTFTFTPGDGDTVMTIQGSGSAVTIDLDGPFPLAGITGDYGTLVITNVSGGTVSYTYTLTDNVDHDTQTPQDDFIITVDDSDGNVADKVTDTLTIHITDDEPLDYQPDEAIMENTGTDTFTGKLDDDDTLDNDGGADSIASLVFDIPDSPTGTPLLDTDGNAVKVAGQPVLLFLEADGSITATTDTDNSDPAMVVFTATLDAATSSYTIDFDRPLDNGSTTASDLSAVNAGNTPWAGFDPDVDAQGDPLEIQELPDPNPDSTDLLFTGYNGSTLITVNNDADDIGTGSGQKVNPNEYLRVDMVQDLRYDPGSDESDAGGYLYDQHVGQKVFSFSTIDVQGNASQISTVLIKAYNVDDTDPDAQSNVNVADQASVNLDPASVVVHDVNGNLLTAGVDYTVVESGNNLYVTGLGKGDTVTFEAVGGAEFDAVTLENGSGDANPNGGTFAGQPFGLGNFSYGVNDPGDPVEFELPTLLTDGDGDTSSGTIDVTVYPVGQVPEPLTLAANTLSFKTASVQSDSMSLLADDGLSTKSHTRTFDAANSNITLLGAIAAAGLASTSVAAHNRGSVDDAFRSDLNLTSGDGGSKDSLVPDSDTSRSALSGETKEAIDDHGSKSSSLKSHGEENLDHSLTAGDTHDSQPTTELLAGTDAPQQDAPAASMLTSQGVAMPSVEMLTAGKGEGVDKGEAKGNAVVEQVVADALAGGEGGKSIDALLDAITTRGHGGDKGANEALASHGQGDVSHWDTAGLAAFQTHAQFTMESIQLHHDAVQPAA